MSSTDKIQDQAASLLGMHESPMALNRRIFEDHAKQQADGPAYLDCDAFIDAVAPPNNDYHKIPRSQFGFLFEVADRDHDGRVTLEDWQVFQNLLARPDSEYQIAFRLFDVDGADGTISFDDFVRTVDRHRSADQLAFDWSAPWVNLYAGRKSSRHRMSYNQFAQMLRGLQGERVRQAFGRLDRDGDGYITPAEFAYIIKRTHAHKLSDHLLENLETLCSVTAGTSISYSTVRAFQNIVSNMDMVAQIVQSATTKSPTHAITRTEFANEASRLTSYTLFTPMEIEILFHFASLDNPSGNLTVDDFARVLDSTWRADDANLTLNSGTKLSGPPESFLHQVLESLHHFGLGAIAGGLGATAVYPIDLCKTRMQNQRSTIVGEVMYKNGWDCFRKVLSNEGFLGLYSGLGPQLLGVAPEKAIKLTVNDLVRGKATEADGSIKPRFEIMAGGLAGGCQVIVTNPLEVVKIQLQVRGQMGLAASGSQPVKASAFSIVKGLGLVGLYKGALACLCRDIPFSAIYFPAYAHLKKDLFKETPTHPLTIGQLLVAGAIAGMPAAYLTTPADVIKTRLQVQARKGDTVYTGIRDAARKILHEEGFKTFFRGGLARVLRSSPQFGVTLASYEVLQNLLPMPGSTRPEQHMAAAAAKAGAAAGKLARDESPLPFIRSRNALKMLLDLDIKYGNYSKQLGK